MQQERREASIWSGKVFSSGWVEARGGVCDVTDPSNGDLLGVTGIANGEDVAAAAAAVVAPRAHPRHRRCVGGGLRQCHVRG